MTVMSDGQFRSLSQSVNTGLHKRQGKSYLPGMNSLLFSVNSCTSVYFILCTWHLQTSYYMPDVPDYQDVQGTAPTFNKLTYRPAE